MNPATIKIKVGEQGLQFLQNNNLSQEHVNKQPAGLNFYRYRWPATSPGAASIEHGPHSFKIPHALSVMGTEDVEHMDAGITTFTINAGITAAETVAHEEARQTFINMLQNLLKLGWKPLIFYNYPRLNGEEAFHYYEEDDTYGIPPDYEPTMEEWMRIDFDNWYLWTGNQFLTIKFRRGVEGNDPKQSAYLFIFTIHNGEEEAKANFEGEDRERWQDLWIEKVKSLKKERYEKEALLEKRGFNIFREYEEPKIHPADPVEP